MKHMWMGAAACLVAAGWMTSGCDWQAGSSSDTVSDRYNFANFSGVYKGANNGFLISDYTSDTSLAVTNAGSTNIVSSEVIGSAVAGESVYSGVLAHPNVVGDSVQVQAGVFVLTDNAGGTLSGSGKSGTVVYQTGAWSINLAGEWPPAGTSIIASYRYIIGAVITPATSPGLSGRPGSSGGAIYSFNVTQSGNTVTLTDNNGATYSGKISTIRSTGGVSSDIQGSTSPSPADGDTLIASFEASGTSAAGRKIKITGSFQGLVDYATSGGGTGTGTSTSIPRLTTRSLGGTWIEDTGKTGAITGTAG